MVWVFGGGFYFVSFDVKINYIRSEGEKIYNFFYYRGKLLREKWGRLGV